MADLESTNRNDGPLADDVPEEGAVNSPAGAEGVEASADAAPAETPLAGGTEAAPEADSGSEGETPADSPVAAVTHPIDDPDKDWYIIHTYSGFENKVMQSLRQRADAYGMGDKIGEILGHRSYESVVHRDNLVLTGPNEK